MTEFATPIVLAPKGDLTIDQKSVPEKVQELNNTVGSHVWSLGKSGLEAMLDQDSKHPDTFVVRVLDPNTVNNFTAETIIIVARFRVDGLVSEARAPQRDRKPATDPLVRIFVQPDSARALKEFAPAVSEALLIMAGHYREAAPVAAVMELSTRNALKLSLESCGCDVWQNSRVDFK